MKSHYDLSTPLDQCTEQPKKTPGHISSLNNPQLWQLRKMIRNTSKVSTMTMMTTTCADCRTHGKLSKRRFLPELSQSLVCTWSAGHLASCFEKDVFSWFLIPILSRPVDGSWPSWRCRGPLSAYGSCQVNPPGDRSIVHQHFES